MFKPEKFVTKPLSVLAMRMPEEYANNVDPVSDSYEKNIQASDLYFWAERVTGTSYNTNNKDTGVPHSGVSIEASHGRFIVSTGGKETVVNPGDWVVQTGEGELHVMPEDVFEHIFGVEDVGIEKLESYSEFTSFSPLPEGQRFDAYYYGFEPTGVSMIDSVLSAVAIAGKGSHHTDSWGEEEKTYGYYDRLGFTDVKSAVDLIQRCANRSANFAKEIEKKIRLAGQLD